MSAYQQWVAFLTIVTKEIRRFTRIWPQTLLPPAITMTLYFVIFGNLIGSRIARSVSLCLNLIGHRTLQSTMSSGLERE